VTDFGLSRVDNGEYENTTATAVGPLKWMAPEQLEFRKFSLGSDVFAFGVLLWEIFTQSRPWPNMVPAFVAISVMDGRRMEIPLSVPLVVRDLMTACWKQSPQERPLMNDIEDDLRLAASATMITDDVSFENVLEL